MSNKNIPIKTSFSGKDYDEWKLHSADFMPFAYQDEFAENINKIIEILENLPRCEGELLESLRKAKSFACSTIIPDGGGFSRVFFNTPQDLRNFIENYKEESHD
ncbi:MAG: hypothetical protein EBV32_04990 [Proteobacteria bacterium]|jgi:hypothetical protein|uniref:Uncharacterized protein n=1 Tax=Candidatus Fonsibacter lacus TaxID=2576439 RepID=A0A964UZ35_9PROT|nr:hypothetical protein [Candidatus Fonsibacter lacus]NBX53390.1 hypothetical protein [Pseudomonadota bacterium]NCA28510.1 hypothetical protein [Pseudomonadota bacterium]NCU72491.1 hypothetical protein [Candidatus Fonsibacter lacus]